MAYDLSKLDPVIGALLKYVRFADGVVLFCDACNMNASHKQLVNERPEVPAVSAGKLKVRGGRWYIHEGGSTTAKLTRLPSDEKYVGRALPEGLRYDPEMMYEI